MEVDLPGAPEDMMVKYSRSYYKWFANNTLFFNNETGVWDSQKVYSKHFKNDASNDFLFIFLEYWNYLLALIIIYFVFSQVINSKRVKDSVKLQRDAVADMHQTMAQQTRAIGLHEDTNQILLDILKELKRRND